MSCGMHFQQRSDRSRPETLGGTRPMHTNSAALKGTDLVALWFAPATFALDETLPPSTFAIGQARRAITCICLIIVRSDNRNEKLGKASPFGQGWELDHGNRPNV